MGADQPFLYDAPPSSSSTNNPSPCKAYNPKAASQASFHVPVLKPKHEGPLVDFNKHPDSYLILPYGNLNVRPMSAGTRNRVRYARAVLLLLRCVELLGAIGLLVCVICLREIDDVMGWTLRIPPGLAILHSLYAIYHLSRGSARRTPASSASYMLFSAAADTSLLPFYVFTALMSNTQYAKHGGAMKWTSVFDDPSADEKLVRAVFFLVVINGALHLLSLSVSLFLAIIYKQISKLPPDMNPLEGNLTSRHKRNRSSVISSNEKRTSQPGGAPSTAAAAASNPGPTYEPLIPPPRTIPFIHTRTESQASLNRSQAGAHRASRADLPSQLYQDESRRASRVEITRSIGATHSPSSARRSLYEPVEQTPTPPKRSSRHSLIKDNWYTTYLNHSSGGGGGGAETNENLARAPTVSTVSSMKDYELRLAQSHNGSSSENEYYHPLEQVDLYDDNDDDGGGDLGHPLPNPLEAHPPTPPPALQPGSSPGRIASIKAKLYGDLRAATPPVMVGTYVDLPPAGAGGAGGGMMDGHRRGRVISNSGTEYAPAVSEKRNVSGKIAEEGRAGAWARLRKVSGR
ncbi:MAG: hypothetical protein M1816_006305 [Peltula sp. TS41687]|nr:MAG: hypothetical protein M1816_006305 [Peltula sp. TS41687]